MLLLLYGPAVTTVCDHLEDQRPLLAEYCLCFSTHGLGLSCSPAKKQMSSDFMAAVTIQSDFGAQEIKSVIASTFTPSFYPCHEVMGPDAMIIVF